MKTVAFIAAGASQSGSAVGARIGAFARGLDRSAWQVRVFDVAPPRPSRYQVLIEQAVPPRLRALLDASGCEGDIMPSVLWHARRRLRAVRADVAVVSVPPFSLLAAALFLPRRIPLVVDYRDPWSARERPHPLGRASRGLERLAARRAAAVAFAGHPRLGQLLSEKLGIPARRVVAVANGIDPVDLDGVAPHSVKAARNGTPLDLVFVGHWYGRNGPGILLDALEYVSPNATRLTILGTVSPSIAERISTATGGSHIRAETLSRAALCHRLAEADAAIVTMDYTSAVESRVPAKIYDYVGVGVPVIVVCPSDTGLLTMPEAQRFHHVDHRDTDGLIRLLRQAASDRKILNGGLADGHRYSRTAGVSVLHDLLLTACGGSESDG
jgi:hypothetical protein